MDVKTGMWKSIMPDRRAGVAVTRAKSGWAAALMLPDTLVIDLVLDPAYCVVNDACCVLYTRHDAVVNGGRNVVHEASILPKIAFMVARSVLGGHTSITVILPVAVLIDP